MIICEECGEIISYSGSMIEYDLCGKCNFAKVEKIFRRGESLNVKDNKKISKSERIRQARKNSFRKSCS